MRSTLNIKNRKQKLLKINNHENSSRQTLED